MATILYEGLPIRPDAGIWWRLVEKYRVTAMFTRADRDPRAEEAGPEAPARARPVEPARAVPRRRAARRADRALDRRRARQAGDRQLLADRERLADPDASPTASSRCRAGSAARACAMYGFDVRLVDETTGADIVGAGREGRASRSPGRLPPGFMQTVWRDDARFVATYWTSIAGRQLYNTFDWGIRDADGYCFILGRTDDVINVAGHRLGTREIEESISSHAERRRGRGRRRRRRAQGPGRDGLRRRRGTRAALATPAAAHEARGRDHEDASTRSSARWRGRRACTSSPRCRRRARASCCGARSRRSASAATPAT